MHTIRVAFQQRGITQLIQVSSGHHYFPLHFWNIIEFMLFSYFPITSTVHQNVEKYELTDRKTSIVFVVKLILRANPAEKKTDGGFEF